MTMRQSGLAMLVALLFAGWGPVGTATPSPDDLPVPPSCPPEAPCTMEPGTVQGRLVRGIDEEHHYRIHVPDTPIVLRIRLDATTTPQADMHIILTDAEGVRRAEDFGNGSLDVSAVGAPAGAWTLTVAVYRPVLMRLPPWGSGPQLPNVVDNPAGLADYTAILVFEHHDHLTAIEAGPAMAQSVITTCSAPYAYLDVVYESAITFPGNDSDTLLSAVRLTRHEDGAPPRTSRFAGLWSASRIPETETEVWTKGLVVDPHVRLQPIVTGSTNLLRATYEHDESRAPRVDLDMGFAYSYGISRARAFLVWDDAPGAGPTQVSFPDGDVGTFRAISHFEADDSGFGAQAGMVSHGQNLSTRFTVPNGTVPLVFVRGTLFDVDGRLTVTPPGQAPVTLVGTSRFWTYDDAPAGTWNVRIDKVTSLELGQLRVGMAAFAFPQA